MYRLLLFIVAVFVALPSFSVHRGIALVIDSTSLREAHAEFEAYCHALEEVQGYHVYTVVDRWGIPDSIRSTLISLHGKKQDPICGVVLIGDIPIPMIRDAQYLTSAFKMDQDRPRTESSVPSDRYYDDFGLDFSPLGSDEGKPLFYYSLTTKGDQTIHPDIFSGRIRPTDTPASSRYEKLRNFLRKATLAKRNPIALSHVFSFSGQGSLTESKRAFVDEFRGLDEHFPQLASTPDAFTFMNFADVSPLKQHVMNELMKPDRQLAILHHHGDYDTQYLGMKKEDNLVLHDFDSLNFRPACTVVLFDACYNAAFQNEDCIANEYIFQPGATVATIGGTVNLIQDKWYDEYIGALAHGMNVGQLNQYTAFLETHVVGDPTFTFINYGKVDLCHLLADADHAPWRRLYADSTQADIRSIALRHLVAQEKVSDADLLRIVTSESSALVRLQAFMLLKIRRSSLLADACRRASMDNYEMLQRFAVSTIGEMARPDLMPALARVLVDGSTSARVAFNACQETQFFTTDGITAAVKHAIDSIIGQVVQPDSFRMATMKHALHYAGFWDEDFSKLTDGALDKKHSLRNLSYMKLYLPDHFVEPLIAYFHTVSDSDIQRAVLHVLGWHPLTWHASAIASFARSVSTDSTYTPAVRDEALRTCKRLSRNYAM